ncbi:MAG: ABC transporter ATP-binding protein [Thermodesulfobacteriota bacterium]
MLFRVQGLTAFYDKSQILHGVDLEVRRGEIVALLGRNGVGKSTTLRSIMGIVRPASGTIDWDGKPVQGLRSHRIARLGIGYVPEDRAIFERLSVTENLLMGRRAMRGREQAAVAWGLDRIYSVFPILKDRQHQRGTTLSGGEQQMLTIARTLMGNPSLLLVDEPTEGLAPLIRKMVAQILKEINQAGVSILLVEQNMKMALKLAVRGYVMAKGQIVFTGTSDEILQADDIRRRYLEV